MWRHSWDKKILKDIKGCWLWRGAKKQPSGHAIIYVSNKEFHYLHRITYENKYGPIPSGYHIHHKCQAPNCINPDHLEALPKAEHHRIHGKLGKGRHILRGYRKFCP